MASAMENAVSDIGESGLTDGSFTRERPKRKFFSSYLGVLMALVAAGPTLAADLSPQPPEYQPPPSQEFSWTGIYAGINVGGGIDHFGFKYFVSAPQLVGFQQCTAGITSLGPLGGLQCGFNYELPFFHIVAGLEFDNSAAGISGQTSVNNILGLGLPFSATFA